MAAIDVGSLEFALKLEKVLSSDTKNQIISPFSLSTALAMTLMGAQSASGEELSQVLFGKTIKKQDYQALAKEFKTLVQLCVASNEAVLSSANFMYTQNSYPILPEYKQTIESSFGAKARELDFISQTSEAIDAINGDISNATKGKIETLFDDIDVNTKLVLANALYFKGFWRLQFKKEKTEKRKFMTGAKEEVDVDMMCQSNKFPTAYSDELQASAIELAYNDSNIVLVVLLPDNTTSVPEVKSKLTGQLLNELLSQFSANKVEVFLPKFHLETTLPLIPVLSRMGIKQIFDSKLANFSGITSDPLGLYVGEAIQKAVIDVNEEGTEAAAATGMGFLSRSLPERFEVNRPFMFFLISKYEKKKNTILFTGTVNNPNE